MRVALFCCVLLASGAGRAAAQGHPEALARSDAGARHDDPVPGESSISGESSIRTLGLEEDGTDTVKAVPAAVSELPRLSNDRYNEDYTILRDAALARDAGPLAIAPLKYVPLDKHGES